MSEKTSPSKREVSVNVVVEIGLHLEDLQGTYDAIGKKALHDALRTACTTLDATMHEKIRTTDDWIFLVLTLPRTHSIINFITQIKRLSTLALSGIRPGASSRHKINLWSRSYSVRSRDASPPSEASGGVHDHR